ncbi:MAG: serine hydrolase domain-containing protein [Geminicoccaceae bacterium]
MPSTRSCADRLARPMRRRASPWRSSTRAGPRSAATASPISSRPHPWTRLRSFRSPRSPRPSPRWPSSCSSRTATSPPAILARFLPDFPNAGRITLRDLLVHTSGIAEFTQLPPFATDQARDWRPDELIALVAAAPPLDPPGQVCRYGDSGYILLGRVVEELASDETSWTMCASMWPDGSPCPASCRAATRR